MMDENDKQTELKIFDAATKVFIEKGMDGARMQEIADKAGINKSLLHYYFRSKEKLFNEVFEKIANNLFGKFAPLLDENLSLEEKIRFFFSEHIEMLKKNPGLPAFVLNEMNRNPERIRILVRKADVRKIWNKLWKLHGEEFERYNITLDTFPQLMTSIAALSVFPFVGKELISTIIEAFDRDFDDYIETRKEFVADFVIRAIKG